MARRYREVTYQEPVGRGFLGTIAHIVKWAIIILIILAVIGAVI